MTTDGRTPSVSVSGSESPRSDLLRDGGGAAGHGQTTNGARREALRRLITKGHYIRRTDGDYGRGEDVMPAAMARDLKAKKYATPGFNHTIYPTLKGRRFVEEG